MTFRWNEKRKRWVCGKSAVTTLELARIAEKHPKFRMDHRVATTG